MPGVSRLVKFKCIVGSVRTPNLSLNGKLIKLTNGGSGWTGADVVNVVDTVLIHPTVAGKDGDNWSVTITTDCPGGATPDKIFDLSGPIPENSHGAFEFIVTSPVPATPCAAAK